MSMGVGTFTLKTRLTCTCFPGVAPNTTQPKGDCRAIRLAASLVSPVCSLGWSMPTSRSTGPFFLRISSFPKPKIPATWLSFISVMSLLIHGMSTAVTVWITLRFASLTMPRHIRGFYVTSATSPDTHDAYRCFTATRPTLGRHLADTLPTLGQHYALVTEFYLLDSTVK